MKKNALTLAVLGLVAGAASAQDVKVNAIVDLWYTQMLSDNLRQNSTTLGDLPAKYYQLNSAFQENGFSVRRCELYLAGKISEEISYNVMFDPNTSTSATNPTTLADAYITYKPLSYLSIRAGQFKPLQTYEASMVPVPEVLFYDRSQLARQFGDKRDRGIVVTGTWGNPEAFWGKANVGIFNGTGDRDGGKGNDLNAQKDFVTRVEFGIGKQHKFGAYTRHGSTDAADKGALAINGFDYTDLGPTDDAIRGNRDKTTNYGVYYAFENGTWIAQGEAITGALGRRFASVGLATPANRQHLDQKFFGLVATGGFRTGPHTFLLRYDYLNYNQGDKFYGPYNPYTQDTETGAPLSTDYTPKYTEIVAGWNYAFTPSKWTLANLKVNYIHRSSNFLAPRAGQTGEQGGDSLVVALQVAF